MIKNIIKNKEMGSVREENEHRYICITFFNMEDEGIFCR